MSASGHELPRHLTGSAAEVPLKADTKADDRCGWDGPRTILRTAKNSEPFRLLAI